MTNQTLGNNADTDDLIASATIQSTLNNESKRVEGTINDLKQNLIETIMNSMKTSNEGVTMTIVNALANRTYQITNIGLLNETIDSEINNTLGIIQTSDDKSSLLQKNRISIIIRENTPADDIIDLIDWVLTCLGTICV